MLRAETSLRTRTSRLFTNNGTSSMLTNGRKIQRRENSMKSLDSMSKETSTLYLNYQATGTSPSSTRDSPSRFQMVSKLKSGTSTKSH